MTIFRQFVIFPPLARSLKEASLTDRFDSLILRKKYGRRFPGTDLHHPIPTSRLPKSFSKEEKENNNRLVFPYIKRSHRTYHILFWNLRIDEVWNILDRIHSSIFETDKEHIHQWWIEGCDLEGGKEKQKNDFQKSKFAKIGKMVRTAQLESLWSRTFGGEDLVTAENLLKMMMLFMVFGSKLLDQEELFDNGNLQDFFEGNTATGYQLWAFKTLFGEGGSVQGIKSKMAAILNANDFYSS